MRSISRRAWNTVLFASLSWLAAGEASARIIYKCEDPIHGKTRFSKERCAPLEKQQVLPPLLGGDQHPDVLVL